MSSSSILSQQDHYNSDSTDSSDDSVYSFDSTGSVVSMNSNDSVDSTNSNDSVNSENSNKSDSASITNRVDTLVTWLIDQCKSNHFGDEYPMQHACCIFSGNPGDPLKVVSGY